MSSQILYVEDNDADALLLMRFLETQGQTKTIHRVTDGMAVLKYLETCSALPEFIILDLGLPKLNGHEVLRAIRADSKTRAIPVVIVTTSTHAMDQESCDRLGVIRYIAKPEDLSGFDILAKKIIEISHSLPQ